MNLAVIGDRKALREFACIARPADRDPRLFTHRYALSLYLHVVIFDKELLRVYLKPAFSLYKLNAQLCVSQFFHLKEVFFAGSDGVFLVTVDLYSVKMCIRDNYNNIHIHVRSSWRLFIWFRTYLSYLFISAVSR